MLAGAVLLTALAAPGAPVRAADLLDLSIEELGRLEVTSVSRRAQRLSDTAAAVHVITRDEIHASGVSSIPEALRLAPGVEVARNGSHSWTITLRGFNSDLSDQLLVLIDGRSVYSPLFAGVFWDAQDTLLEDVERIEVIAGPGGAIWGANAVNGVINIITRSAWDSQGGFAELGAGNEQELVAGFRYGVRLGPDLAGRAYLKHFERDGSRALTGGGAGDDWEMSQAGFRLDWAGRGRDTFTLQGDVYDADESDLLRGDFTLGTLPEVDVPGTVDVAGHNLLARWQRQLGDGAELRLQAYYDHTERDIPGAFSEDRDTGDVDLVHALAAHGRHQLIWGGGVRVTSDDIGNTRFAAFDPDSRTDETYSLFLQDRIDVYRRKVFLTLGTKLEHNQYSGSEHQPNVRVTWLASPQQTVWGAVSRAVRVPARLNHDLELHAPVAGLPLPLYLNVRGTEDFEPEELTAYEMGYRMAVGAVSVDLSLYYNDYDKLLTNEVLGPTVPVPGPQPYLILPIVLDNNLRGETYGGTLDVKWQPHPAWRLEFYLSRTEFDLELRPGSGDAGALSVAGNSPENQAGVHSYLELPRGFTLYTGVRYVDELPNQGVPDYLAVDANLRWEVTPRLTASVTARNLDDRAHREFGDDREIERSVLFRLNWAF